MSLGINGPPPNPNRQRRNADTLGGFRVLIPDGVLRGEELPPFTPNGTPWHPKTLIWWNTWRRSPLAQLIRDTDWLTLEKAALLYDTIWSTAVWPKPADLATLNRELDRMTANYGATYADRLKLRILIEDEDPKEVVEAAKKRKDTHYEELFKE